MAKSRGRRAAPAAPASTEVAVTAANPAVEDHQRKSQPVTEEAIRMLAFYKWERAGKPEGNDLCFWLEAERELNGAS
jgi:hypothetical protein